MAQVNRSKHWSDSWRYSTRGALAAAGAAAALWGALGVATASTPDAANTPAVPAATGTPDAAGPLAPVIVSAPEPRYVAPTLRDKIGRIWAPVYLDGKGPFRLVLDSGATTSGVNASVARALGLPNGARKQLLLRGVVGRVAVPALHVTTMTVGDLAYGSQDLAVLSDPLGGADGILSTAGMHDARVFIDFHHDRISISHSRNQAAPDGFVIIPFQRQHGQLIVADAWIGGVRASGIIDTGGQVTIANIATRGALARWRAQLKAQPDAIEDVTQAIQSADRLDAPPIMLGSGLPDRTVRIGNEQLTFGNMHIFEHWGLTAQPALLIGMDALGLLDVMIIDYRRQELQVRLSEP